MKMRRRRPWSRKPEVNDPAVVKLARATNVAATMATPRDAAERLAVS